ncbi:MAG: hypothetical protein AAF915_19290 [Cyanobacteria bacterium P01_D01_bin.50]
MYSTDEVTRYEGYVIQLYYHSHQVVEKQWGYRIWKGYELMCVDGRGCKSSQEAVAAAKQEIDKGFHRICCS